MPLPAHLFACSDGALYDTRAPDWNARPPLRRRYTGASAEPFADFAAVKAALRSGPYAWPGGYPLYFVAADGEALSFAAVRANLREVVGAFQPGGARDWRPVGVAINYEDSDLTCAHTGERIESAYGEPDENEENA